MLIAAAALCAINVLFLALHGLWDGYAFNLGACLLLALYVLVRRIVRPGSDRERAVLALVLALLCCGILVQNQFNRVVGMYDKLKIRTWNIYHYYLGSKYFDELGFEDLYIQTIVADRQIADRLKNVHRIRDMADYEIKPVDQLVGSQRSQRFSDERWEEFKSDLGVLLPKASRATWPSILIDRGYNPTPFYNTVVSAISNNIDLHKRGQVLLATHIDILCYVAIIAAVAWAFGPEAAMLLFLAFALLPFNVGRLIGGYVQYDWMAAVVLGVCFLRKRLPLIAGMAFGYATMARVFPLILAAGLAAPVLLRMIRQRKIDRFGLKFALAFGLVCIVGVGVGSLSQRGFSAWTEWRTKIAIHNEHMIYGEGRVGLKHIFTHKLGADRKFESINERRQMLAGQKNYYYVAAAIMLLLLLAVIWFQRDVNAVLLAMVAFYALFVPSHYYWSILALLPLWQTSDEGPWRPVLFPALFAFIVPAGWYFYALHHSDDYARYIRFDWVLGVCLFVWLGMLLYQAISRQNATSLKCATSIFLEDDALCAGKQPIAKCADG